MDAITQLTVFPYLVIVLELILPTGMSAAVLRPSEGLRLHRCTCLGRGAEVPHSFTHVHDSKNQHFPCLCG